MDWQPDRLLLEMFESLQKEFASALEVLQRRQESGTDTSDPQLRDSIGKIAKLRNAMEALEVALERPESRIVH